MEHLFGLGSGQGRRLGGPVHRLPRGLRMLEPQLVRRSAVRSCWEQGVLTWYLAIGSSLSRGTKRLIIPAVICYEFRSVIEDFVDHLVKAVVLGLYVGSGQRGALTARMCMLGWGKLRRQTLRAEAIRALSVKPVKLMTLSMSSSLGCAIGDGVISGISWCAC